MQYWSSLIQEQRRKHGPDGIPWVTEQDKVTYMQNRSDLLQEARGRMNFLSVIGYRV